MLSIWSSFDTRVKMEECFIYFYMYRYDKVFRKHWKACWVYFDSEVEIRQSKGFWLTEFPLD